MLYPFLLFLTAILTNIIIETAGYKAFLFNWFQRKIVLNYAKLYVKSSNYKALLILDGYVLICLASTLFYVK